MQLRPYQEESIQLLNENFRRHKRQILCLPTGAGKTVTFAEMTKRASEKGKTVLILTDRTELCTQALKTISKHDLPIERIDPTNKKIYEGAKIFVAMVETLNNRIKKGLNINPDLIIIDEAHKGNFTKILDLFPNCFVVGATATPIGKHIIKYYTNIIQNIDIPELIESGYLSTPKAFQMVDDFSDLKKEAGEFTEESQLQHFKKSKVFDGFVDVFDGKKTLVFCCNIQHSIDTCEAFRARNIKSEVVTSLTQKEERERILKSFNRGYFDVLVNCGILTTGYDEPTIENIIIVRATTSLALWLQMCGRGSRVIPEKKERFTIYDFGGNHDRHGLWNAERVWSLEEKKKKKSEGISPVKSCPKCEAMLAVSAKFCEYCEYEFPILEKEISKGVLVEVVNDIAKVPEHLKGLRVKDLSIVQLSDLQKSKKYKPTFIWRILRGIAYSDGSCSYELQKGYIQKYANIFNYKKGWVKSQLEKINDCDFPNFILK